MPGTGTYTQDAVDTLIADLQTQMNIRATRAELSAHSAQNQTLRQSNTNSITTLNAKVGQLEGLSSELSRRLQSTTTIGVSYTWETTEEESVAVFRAYADMTAAKVSVYIDSGSIEINAANQGTNMLATNLTGIAGNWNSTTVLTNAGLAEASGLSVQIIGQTGVSEPTIQIDLTLDNVIV